MANSFATIEKWLSKVVDTVFATESKTRDLEVGGKYIDLDFNQAGAVRIANILMDGLSDYYRAGANGVTGSESYAHYNSFGDGTQRDGYDVGGASLKWEIFKLTHDRAKQFQIDNMDNEETASVIIANLLSEFVRTKVVPEVDVTRFSTLAGTGSASFGNLITAKTIDENKIINDFNTAYEWLAEHEVPEEEQVIYVNPSVMAKIRNTTELYKRLTQDEYHNGDISFKIMKYEGRPIIEVPSSRFFTNVGFGRNGYYATANSKLINYMVVSKKSAVPVVKLEKSKIWTPEMVQDFDGYKVNFRLYHDIFLPENKIAGVYTSVSATTATTKANLLDIDIELVATGAYKVNRYFTTPAGIHGTLVHSASAFTVGATYASAEEVSLTNTFGKIGSETKQYFAVLDANKVAVAVSKEITLPTA